MARIGIDATPISIHGKGLSHFLVSLLYAIHQYSEDHSFTILINQSTPLPDLPSSPRFNYVSVPVKSSVLWDIFQLPSVLRHHSVDILLSCSDRLPLFYSGVMQLYLFELPKIRHNLHYQYQTPSLYARLSMTITDLLFPISVYKAKSIITSSNATKQALLDNYKLPPSKIEVIYPGRDQRFSPIISAMRKQQIRAQFHAHNGYVLHFSSQSDPRDNTEVAVRAFHASQIAHTRQIKLVIAGKTNPEKQGIATIVQELELENHVIWAGYIPEEDLVDVYRSADLYLDPSLYEGFGYQVLEAMACGIPVVCSNTTSLPEIVGEAAITVAPNDVLRLAQAVTEVFSSIELAHSMSVKGIIQAEKFAWRSTIQALLDSQEHLLCV